MRFVILKRLFVASVIGGLSVLWLALVVRGLINFDWEGSWNDITDATWHELEPVWMFALVVFIIGLIYFLTLFALAAIGIAYNYVSGEEETLEALVKPVFDDASPFSILVRAYALPAIAITLFFLFVKITKIMWMA